MGSGNEGMYNCYKKGNVFVLVSGNYIRGNYSYKNGNVFCFRSFYKSLSNIDMIKRKYATI